MLSRSINPKEVLNKLPAVLALAVLFTTPVAADKLSVIPANEASREAFQVNKRMGWHENLQSACEQARKENKLVFWMHMLGTMDGST